MVIKWRMLDKWFVYWGTPRAVMWCIFRNDRMRENIERSAERVLKERGVDLRQKLIFDHGDDALAHSYICAVAEAFPEDCRIVPDDSEEGVKYNKLAEICP